MLAACLPHLGICCDAIGQMLQLDCLPLGDVRCNLQELGDRNQLVSRLTEKITEVDAASQAAKAQRNAALDVRKAAWQRESDLKDKVHEVEQDFQRAFSVSCCTQLWAAWPTLRSPPRLSMELLLA